MIHISILCFSYAIAAVGFQYVSSEIEVYNSNNRLVKTFTSDFSYEGDFDPVVGLIVLADPPDACTPIKHFNIRSNSTFEKFVLIGGSPTENCSIGAKIDNAGNADFNLAILFGDREIIPRSYSFFKKFFSADGDDDEGIIAIKVPFNDGEIIKTHYLFKENSTEFYYLRITSGTNVRYYIVLFATVIAVCFIVIIFFMICLLAKYIQERRRSRRNRLSSRQIKQLPTEKYTKGSPYDVCAICLENYNEGDKLRVLPCSHVYHTKCVDPWLMENRRNCPLCKRKVHLGDTSSESESDSEGASVTESTPLITPTSTENTWGTFSGPSTSGEQLRRPGSQQHSGRIQSHNINSSQDDADLSESDNIAILPSVAGSVNAAYEDELNDSRPKSV